MSLKWIILGILALPAAELVLFILVAADIGFLRAAALQIAISLAGLLLLRQAGSARLSRLKAKVKAVEASGWQFQGAPGVMMLAGILLVIPGFVTDLIGVALLVPPLRHGLATLMRKTPAPRQAGRSDAVIDLGPNEWRDITKTKPRKKRGSPTHR